MELSREILLAQYKKEAKAADTKLRSLESAARRYNDDKYLQYAYSRAMRDLKSHGLGTRFDKKIPDTVKESKIQKMLSDARRFNEASTSSFAGYQELDEQRYKTLTNPKNTKASDWFPTDMTQEEFLKITQLGVWDLLSEDFGFGYQTAIRVAKSLTRNKKFIMNRQSKMKFDSMANILKKYKFTKDPDLADKVQGRLKDMKLI